MCCKVRGLPWIQRCVFRPSVSRPCVEGRDARSRWILPPTVLAPLQGAEIQRSRQPSPSPAQSSFLAGRPAESRLCVPSWSFTVHTRWRYSADRNCTRDPPPSLFTRLARYEKNRAIPTVPWTLVKGLALLAKLGPRRGNFCPLRQRSEAGRKLAL